MCLSIIIYFCLAIIATVYIGVSDWGFRKYAQHDLISYCLLRSADRTLSHKRGTGEIILQDMIVVYV